ncbi:hypothetical protein V5O48_003056 [Marasmius crinis-equi]|uniref:ZZ-type domain-containing protein n=1 Tax=Marasmius crinis-equi TaxID=585013 RepID=A0ABR3FU05_9AGAR
MALALSAEIEEAQKKLDASQTYQASKGEKALNVVGDKVLAASDSQRIAFARGEASAADFSTVKEKISNFKDNCKILVEVLDKVGSVHPFVQAAVVAFKTGIQLEIARRENDDRVVALNMTMYEMMSVLRPLAEMKDPRDKRAVEERLQDRMFMIIRSIKDCAELCDSYQRRATIVKLFTSIKWQPKFTALAKEFVEHRNALQLALQVYVAFEVSTTKYMLSDAVDMMKTVFERMQPGKERKLAEFVRSKGGHLDNPSVDVLKAAVEYEQQQQQNDKDEKANINKNEAGKDEKVTANLGGQRTEMHRDVRNLQEEIQKDVDTILKENRGVFEKRFGAIEYSLKEIRGFVHRESDRVIKMLAGPHEKIRDRNVYHVWREMGWKGSVKATYLVLALNDHFSEKSRQALAEAHMSTEEHVKVIALIAGEGRPTTPIEDPLPVTPAEDLWSLNYITIHRIQPLIEALDEDGSSFITVTEVNTFTSSRPESWSLPKWIAYWTIGFEMTTHWYYQRICRLLSLIARSSKRTLPANRRIVSEFMRDPSVNDLQDHLSGLQNVDSWDSMQWNDTYIFLQFKGWVTRTERRMDDVLGKLVYYIDQDNILHTVTGGGRAEKYMMPLFCLLLGRAFSVMQKSHEEVLDPGEFQKISISLSVVLKAIRDRVEKLKAIYTLQSLQAEDRLRSMFFGLYTYTFDWPKDGGCSLRDPDFYDNRADELASEQVITTERELYHEPLTEELDLGLPSLEPSLPNTSAAQEASTKSENGPQLVGAWSGSYSHYATAPSFGQLSLSITQHTADDRFRCTGIDMWGPFLVNGRLDGERILFLKKHEKGHNDSAMWRYQGKLNGDQWTISGEWGYPLYDQEETKLLAGVGSDEDGHVNEEVREPDRGDNDPSIPVIVVEAPTVDPESDQEAPDHSSEEGFPSGDGEQFNSWVAVGTFVLTRRPVEYALCRPPDQEFHDSRPRALWTLVRNVAKHWYQSRHLSWETIRQKRDKRKAYLKLWEIGSRWGFDNEGIRDSWNDLVQSLHPQDSYLWRTVAEFKYRRDPVHWGMSCDSCYKSSLLSSRIICLECSSGGYSHTLDLCFDCLDNDVRHKNHKASHPRIQLRRSPFRIEISLILENAAYRLYRTSAEVAKCCLRCKKDLLEKPYWQCVECKDDIFICVDCNKADENEKPWLIQRKPTPEGLHDWMHILILDPKDVPTTPNVNEPPLTTEQRLAKVENELQMVTTRLQSMEEILKRMFEGNNVPALPEHEK